MTRLILLAAFAVIVTGSIFFAAASVPNPVELRSTAKKAFDAGNFKDAYSGYAALALDPDDDRLQVSDDLTQAIQCLGRLGRSDETDDFREKAIALHAKNWRLLWTAAKSYLENENYGYVVAGKFYRGNHRGNDGRMVSAAERDRVRALQLMRQAVAESADANDKDALGEFYLSYADILLDNRFGDGAWRLQFLTDLSKLPDFDEQFRYFNGQVRGAPVDEKGQPIFYQVPDSFEKATTDGQRWRWCLVQAQQISPAMAGRATFTLASFLHSQFGVQTMAQGGYGGLFGRGGDDDDTKKDESGPFAVNSLSETETIARLANGIKRFNLPPEFNYIKLLQKVADTDKTSAGEESLDLLAQIFENRQQYDRAAGYWKLSIGGFGAGPNHWKQDRLDQIVGNWGQFEPVQTRPAGAEASLQFLFRNGKHVQFDAWELNAAVLLADVKTYIKAPPKQLEWQNMQLDNIGWRIVEQGQEKYRGKHVAAWAQDLEPRPKHFDRRVMIKTPLKKGGAYLITSKMDGGNTSNLVLWLADTILVKKPMPGGAWCYVADAVTGAPIPKANVEFFGYQNRWVDNKSEIRTRNFAENTDADGQVKLNLGNDDQGFQWIISATTPQGRLAYLGFTSVWAGNYTYDAQYNQRRVFAITDRPVYRPAQTVRFKFWVGQAQYDKEGDSQYANQAFTVQINNPKNEKVMEKTFIADNYGGFDGDFTVGSDATLGVYSIHLPDGGGGSFRVEEYKKPEFEVKVDAPTEPIMLGEKVTATVSAKYYFGAPVISAKLKYKVLRTSYSANWYPIGPWDWFYEPGYWWFAPNYEWYPGWRDWGCRRPMPGWWWGRSYEQPEVVSENEAPIGKDGTIKIEIDTAVAKLVHGDSDHKYEISAEVTDESRRTIVGTGTVMVARKPFKVYTWVDRGYFNVGDTIEAHFSAQTLDNKPVKGAGELRLLQVSYKHLTPVETEVQKWQLDTNDRGTADQKLKASKPGQYRLSYTVADAKGRKIEGGYVFVIRGEGFDGHQFRFNDIELTTDQKEYQPGDSVKLMINSERQDATVVAFIRASNGVVLDPKFIHLNGKSTLETIGVVKKDMPNFFVEALTIFDGKVADDVREIVVPPENRVINVEVLPSAQKFRPGEKAHVKIKLTDSAGQPVAGSAVVSMYDKAVEYISGGSNVPEIKSFFWKWRRSHNPNYEESASQLNAPLVHSGQAMMQVLGAFGYIAADSDGAGVSVEGATTLGVQTRIQARQNLRGLNDFGFDKSALASASPAASDAELEGIEKDKAPASQPGGLPGRPAGDGPSMAAATVRTNFADTALWVSSLETDKSGIADVQLTMPENLTTWKTRVWSIGSGTRVGQGEAEVLTYKNLIVRLQAPRFFVQKDEMVLSANVHNYLATKKNVHVVLELDGPTLGPVVWSYREMPPGFNADAKYSLDTNIEVAPNSDKRVDFPVHVFYPGSAVVRVKALTDEESDATQLSFPVYIHGMLKTDSYAGAMRPEDKDASLAFNVPKERLVEQSRIEVRYSPSVASAMVDALPYLVDYPYGCTEQTLNRFLPTVITQKVLLSMNLNLKDIEKKRTNLNAQEIGDDPVRAADWKRNNPPNPDVSERNPVFDEAIVQAMAQSGLERLTNMQCSDGGWGWFSGLGEQSWPHTTALVVHGLQIAKQNEVAIVPGVLERGVEWLKRYQAEQARMLKNAPTKTQPWKERADNIDAYVYMVLADAGVHDNDMDDFLYRDRVELAVYAKALYGLALQKQGEKDRLDMIMQNILQFVVTDNENQTAYLRLPANNYWWTWYGSDTEAMAYYLKLLSRTDPKAELPARLAKYLINNRKHASYWNSTRDTAHCIEALADFIKASGESKPDETIAISLDGHRLKEVHIDASNLFSYDNKVVLSGIGVPEGSHKIEFFKVGSGPLYFNAYVSNFTLEDPIKHAGLEIKVSRKFYKLVPVGKTIKAEGSHGQALDQKVEKFERQELADRASVKSGDLVEVELEIDSKNDYEYVLFEDMKAAGFEPVEVRSGYNGNDLNAYMELRDNRVCFFAHELARGKHSVAYRLRAEVPGIFSALPTRVSAMYAPELKANSDEMKLAIQD